MQLHGREGVAQYKLHAVGHVALTGKGLLCVVAHVGTLKKPADDLAQDENANDRVVLDPADQEGFG
jgi:hypothetical protein